MLEVIENSRFSPVQTFLRFEHASDYVFTVLVKTFTYVIRIGAPEGVAAVKLILGSGLAEVS